MKLYRVVQFHPSLGKVLPIHNRLYRSPSQARAMRTRHLGSMGLPRDEKYELAKLVFVEATDTDWSKLK